jgi:hypothetical protein
MKLKYLSLAFFLILPLLYFVGYNKCLNNTKTLVFNIPIVDNLKDRDTIVLTIDLRVPRYYNFNQYIRNESDCITCGDQQYVFFKNPEKQTITEGDSVRIGFYKQWEDGRKRDRTSLSIITYKNVFEGEILDRQFVQEELMLNWFEKIKTMYSLVELNDKRDVSNNGNKTLCIDYNIVNERYNENCLETSFLYKKIPVSIRLNDLTLDDELNEDFYKIVNSIDVKIEYKGDNDDLTDLFSNH